MGDLHHKPRTDGASKRRPSSAYGRASWMLILGLLVVASLCAGAATFRIWHVWALPGVLMACAILAAPKLFGPLAGGIRTWHWLVFVLLLALAVRIMCILATPYRPCLDFDVYHRAGITMARTWTLSVHAAKQHESYRCFFPPGQVFSLGVIYRLFSNSIFAAQALNAVYGTLTVLGVWYLTGRMFSRQVARAASLLAAVMPSMVFGCLLPGAEVSGTFWLIAGLCIYVAAVAESGSRLASLLCGFCFGVASLMRSTFVLLAMPFGLHALLVGKERTTAILCWLAMILGTALVVLPWTCRNYRVSGGFILVSSNGGGNLYSANNDLAQGAYTHSAWEYVFDNGPDDLTLQSVGFQAATDWIAKNPARFCQLAVKKFSLFWGTDKDMAWWATVQPSGQYPELGVPAWIGQLTQGSSCGYYVVCLVAAAVALWRLRKRLVADGRWMVIVPILLYFTLVHMVFEAQAKYHFILMPLLCVLAGLTAVGKERSAERMEGT